MLSSLKKLVQFNAVPLVMAAVVCTVAFVIGPEVFAQEPPPPSPAPVPFTQIVNFGSIFNTIREVIAPLVAGALGLGLAIWAARFIFGIIKSMGR